jgi:hypothetical protein
LTGHELRLAFGLIREIRYHVTKVWWHISAPFPVYMLFFLKLRRQADKYANMEDKYVNTVADPEISKSRGSLWRAPSQK